MYIHAASLTDVFFLLLFFFFSFACSQFNVYNCVLGFQTFGELHALGKLHLKANKKIAQNVHNQQCQPQCDAVFLIHAFPSCVLLFADIRLFRESQCVCGNQYAHRHFKCKPFRATTEVTYENVVAVAVVVFKVFIIRIAFDVFALSNSKNWLRDWSSVWICGCKCS